MSRRSKSLWCGLSSFAVLASLGAATPALASSGGGSAHFDTSAATEKTTLRGVSAVSASDVWAVGFKTKQQQQVFQTLTEHWDGSTWSRVASPNPTGQSVSDLLAVDAVSASDVWAVGNTGIAETANTLIEHWDGKKWSILPSFPGELYGVSAVAADDVWAVGNYYDSGVSRTQTLHWNGKKWAKVESPALAGHLNSVTAVSADDVWAAGFEALDPNVTLIEHWDGSTWTRVASPHPQSFSELYGISAAATDDVWAVGEYAGSNGQKTLTLHWDGSAWTKVKSKIPPSETNPFLFGVSAGSSSQAWAVGFRLNTNETLANRWNGTKWAQVESPSPTDQPILWGVEALAAKNVWAVGTANDFETGGAVPLIEHWDGKAWTVVPSPSL